MLLLDNYEFLLSVEFGNKAKLSFFWSLKTFQCQTKCKGGSTWNYDSIVQINKEIVIIGGIHKILFINITKYIIEYVISYYTIYIALSFGKIDNEFLLVGCNDVNQENLEDEFG